MTAREYRHARPRRARRLQYSVANAPQAWLEVTDRRHPRPPTPTNDARTRVVRPDVATPRRVRRAGAPRTAAVRYRSGAPLATSHPEATGCVPEARVPRPDRRCGRLEAGGDPPRHLPRFVELFPRQAARIAHDACPRWNRPLPENRSRSRSVSLPFEEMENATAPLYRIGAGPRRGATSRTTCDELPVDQALSRSRRTARRLADEAAERGAEGIAEP